ncbi:interleukin-6 [Takifugu flavidus]|uniref:interleukin-6 n=1 Tax=Takifugu flavidus TaxID=433684 RepID=UPI002543FEF0|nr:interleukin-6 [Takifugu flavidus]
MASISYLLAPLVLAAVLQPTAGAPLDAPTDSPSGETSGEEAETGSPDDALAVALESILGATKLHKNEFLVEFQGEVKYDFLDRYKIPSLPAKCPYSNFGKDACLRRLLEGLLIYSVLLKRVEEEFPSSSILSEVRFYSNILIKELENKVRDRDQVMRLTSSQEEQLLKDTDYPDTFHRKMTAHGILYNLHYFLVDCRRVIINKRAKHRESAGSRVVTAVTFYHQKKRS